MVGKRTVEEARQVYAENMAGYTVGRPAPYAERLLFPLMNGGTQDPDEAMGMMPILNQGAGKVKDTVSGNRTSRLIGKVDRRHRFVTLMIDLPLEDP